MSASPLVQLYISPASLALGQRPGCRSRCKPCADAPSCESLPRYILCAASHRLYQKLKILLYRASLRFVRTGLLFWGWIRSKYQEALLGVLLNGLRLRFCTGDIFLMVEVGNPKKESFTLSCSFENTISVLRSFAERRA